MKKFPALVSIAIFVVSIIFVSSTSDQFVDAGSRKKIHFTQTITSSQDPGQGHNNHQLALVLSPNEGTIYDGSMTFTSSEPVQIVILHEINSQESKGQPIWTVDGKTIYGLSLVDLQKNSGSFEFTGAALALHSPSSKEFTATVSIDGWIRGQPTEVIMQKLELQKEPSQLLSRTNVPATIPMHKGIYEGDQVLYIITDGSDEDYAKTITEKQQWNVEHAPVIANVPENTFQKLFVFKNGVKGDGIYGFQNDVFSSTPAQESKYSALSSIIEVTWKIGQKETEFKSAADVIAAEEGGRVEFNETGIVLNTPQIVWPDGQMTIRSDKEISNEMSYSGGQITEINEEEMSVTFVAHRGWGPDGRTIYYIVTDATPSGPAESMGVVSSPKSASLIAHSGAVDLFQFKNGIIGSGPLGFQAGIAGASLDDENYSPMWRIYLVEWNDPKYAKILETKSDIDSFRADGLLSVTIARPTNSDHIVNCPFIDPFQ
ncbi:MAG: hypothetical protein OEW78_01860 [Nitrosopumilus sp.]|uniref:DUF7482 domain-containing protein n=1 Tax=Nitrosopumilus sp. TaxID=2024843 RepID=UPI002471AFB5|nr:hypothetical protein [Nitrosopumilus sp.]MDH5430614.1 hypothetical protein [Nitrosopumilus sp.]MDH5665268.1 hypothetical protein [Nitrosopumilus sp.]MDH5697058.1 hypothetical protein [Nitrosopumilus sp.]